MRRVGEPRCPDHGVSLQAQTVSQMVDQTMALPEDTRVMLLAPVVRDRKGEHHNLLDSLRSQGFVRVRVNGKIYEIDEVPALDKKRKHNIDVVVDRLKVRADATTRLAESFETALRLADGIAVIAFMDDIKRPPILFSARYSCPHCGYSVGDLEPKLFSFNSPSGACPTCDG
jgi:excinuclease ABC subunit A